jgi:HSP20 family molecular chaperone IbpA
MPAAMADKSSRTVARITSKSPKAYNTVGLNDCSNHPYPKRARLCPWLGQRLWKTARFPVEDLNTGRLIKDHGMTRMTMLSNPLLLGFEDIERLIDRAGKGSGDGYPPYNIERISKSGDNVSDSAELLRITLAVAGFTRDQLEVTLEDKQLTVRGKQQDDKTREYLYRGIAARQFNRTFVLADGIEVKTADLSNGLLSIDLQRLEPERLMRRIEIRTAAAPTKNRT